MLHKSSEIPICPIYFVLWNDNSHNILISNPCRKLNLLIHITICTVAYEYVQVDDIILCTGYLHHYPYLEDQLRLRAPNLMYYNNLYKNTVWTEAANGRMMYIGAMDQYNTFTMFDAQGHWVAKYILGQLIGGSHTVK